MRLYFSVCSDGECGLFGFLMLVVSYFTKFGILRISKRPSILRCMIIIIFFPRLRTGYLIIHGNSKYIYSLQLRGL